MSDRTRAPARSIRTTRELRLRVEAGAAAAGRDFTRRALAEFGWPLDGSGAAPNAADDVVLLVSELLSNACQYGSAPYRVALCDYGPVDGGTVRVEVSDASPAEPVMRNLDTPGAPGGYGMRLVDRLARSWGVDPDADGAGKTVWLEMAPT
ncbi:ATP-binding protein [Streptomyces sp. NPDC049040]|uniref:ATP-binding protein n=1 Tax=Streptomyces sp. NPDC049040 TaxID=3365593 RepID=UPI00371A0BE4